LAHRTRRSWNHGNVALAASEVAQLGKVPVEPDAEVARKVLRLHEALDDHDDVQAVYFNASIPDEVMAEEAK
jgi:transcriptional/translational regulatory protein YebC/TACO1